MLNVAYSGVEWSLALVALALLGVAAVSRRLSGTPITPAMVFVAAGLLVGPEVLGGIDLESSSSAVRALAEATLGLVLFCDASRIDLRQLRRAVGVPLRLLGIGLPLTIALGALSAAAIFGQLTVEEALILGVVLAPTDAALGQAVVTEPRVPGTIRQGLNVESGLNDGICVPLLFAAVAIADVESEISEGRSAGTLLLEEIGFGIVGGVVGGLAVATIIIHAGRRDLIADVWRPVIPAAGAALAYGTAAALGGSGFIAAFVAGMTFRLALGRDPQADQRVQRAGRRRAQRDHLRALRSHPARPRARSIELGARRCTRLSASRSCGCCRWRSRCCGRRPERRRSAFSAGSARAGWPRSCSR